MKIILLPILITWEFEKFLFSFLKFPFCLKTGFIHPLVAFLFMLFYKQILILEGDNFWKYHNDIVKIVTAMFGSVPSLHLLDTSFKAFLICSDPNALKNFI